MRPRTPLPPPRLALLSPAPLALGTTRLAGREVFEAPVLRPIDLTSTHGLEIRVEHLEQMAASYDQKVETAALNFDHAAGGPGHGWCTRLWLRGSVLWARFERLSAAALDGLRSGRWPRRSSEFYTRHPATGGWYFTGLALLGNGRPAVWGLGAARLTLSIDRPLDAPRPRLDLRSETLRNFHKRHGVTDARLAELVARYPALKALLDNQARRHGRR